MMHAAGRRRKRAGERTFLSRAACHSPRSWYLIFAYLVFEALFFAAAASCCFFHCEGETRMRWCE